MGLERVHIHSLLQVGMTYIAVPQEPHLEVGARDVYATLALKGLHSKRSKLAEKFALSAGFGTMELDKGTQGECVRQAYQRPKGKMEEEEPL